MVGKIGFFKRSLKIKKRNFEHIYLGINFSVVTHFGITAPVVLVADPY
jgi:hypothetical protein